VILWQIKKVFSADYSIDWIINSKRNLNKNPAVVAQRILRRNAKRSIT